MTHGLASLLPKEQQSDPNHVASERALASNDSHLISVDALSHYPEVVRRLGGHPEQLLKRAGVQIDSAGGTEFIPYRKFVNLLHQSALELDRPDFGLALSQEQRGIALLGPLEVAMRNSPTLGDALSYYIDHSEVISSAVSLALEHDAMSDRPYFRHEVYVRYPFRTQQASEHAIAALHHGLNAFSEGKVKTKEVWFSHAPLSSSAYYSRYFGARVQFNMPYAALFIDEADLSIALPNSAPALFEMADAFLDRKCNNYKTFSSKVRSILTKCLPSDATMKEAVASKLNLHPKTLQRRLQEEGVSFAELRDQVRRDAALRYLTETQTPITRIAALLGYSETAVLSRRCREWFGCTPSKVRHQAERGAAPRPELQYRMEENSPFNGQTEGSDGQYGPGPVCPTCGQTRDRDLAYEARIEWLELENERLRGLLSGSHGLTEN